MVSEIGADPIFLGISPDDEENIQHSLDAAIEKKVDLIISSAGVSVGAFDYVRSVVQKNGQIDFWKVDMRPGKPIAFGNYAGIPFIGLPGNPVSAFVGFHVFIQPIIRKISGLDARNRRIVNVIAGHDIDSDGRESYLRALIEKKANGILEIRLTGHQGSGNLLSLVQANALLIIPSGVKSVRFGEAAQAWLLNDQILGDNST